MSLTAFSSARWNIKGKKRGFVKRRWLCENGPCKLEFYFPVMVNELWEDGFFSLTHSTWHTHSQWSRNGAAYRLGPNKAELSESLIKDTGISSSDEASREPKHFAGVLISQGGSPSSLSMNSAIINLPSHTNGALNENKGEVLRNKKLSLLLSDNR